MYWVYAKEGAGAAARDTANTRAAHSAAARPRNHGEPDAARNNVGKPSVHGKMPSRPGQRSVMLVAEGVQDGEEVKDVDAVAGQDEYALLRDGVPLSLALLLAA